MVERLGWVGIEVGIGRMMRRSVGFGRRGHVWAL